MMKKIIFALFSCMLMTSCVVEYFDKPLKTQVARDIVADAAVAITNHISVVDIARKAQIWLNATTQDERNAIEDLYFRNNKLRLKGTDLTIVDLCVISTEGKSIADTVWKVESLLGGYQVKNTTGDTYQVKGAKSGGDFLIYNCDLSVMWSKNLLNYKIKGTGSYKRLTDDATFEIVDEYQTQATQDLFFYEYLISQGSITIKNNNYPLLISATYTAHKIAVTVDGISEIYHN